MKLAFVLFKYFPYGGLQRDCLKIAEECLRRGHQVDVYCLEWNGPRPSGLNVEVLKVDSWINYRRYEKFARLLNDCVADLNYDAVIGFNRMRGLDFYFAADPCFALKMETRAAWRSFLPRSQSFLRAEEAVYGKQSKTRILLLSDMDVSAIQQRYGTLKSRFFLLPPGVSKDRVAPLDYQARRMKFRQDIGIQPEQKLLLTVGSGFRVKGLDRVLDALVLLPAELRNICVLMILGQDNQKPFERQAQRLGLSRQVHFMGGRDDAAEFMFAADLMVHPAYRESAGMVLVEAIAAQLPVLVTDTCGYSFHVAQSGAGRVHESPFDIARFSMDMAEMLTGNIEALRLSAAHYLEHVDLFGLAKRAVDIMEETTSC